MLDSVFTLKVNKEDLMFTVLSYSFGLKYKTSPVLIAQYIGNVIFMYYVTLMYEYRYKIMERKPLQLDSLSNAF